MNLTPALVLARLAELRRLYVPETRDEARVRLERERPPDTSTFAERAERNLAVLRALDDLVRHLRQARLTVDGAKMRPDATTDSTTG